MFSKDFPTVSQKSSLCGNGLRNGKKVFNLKHFQTTLGGFCESNDREHRGNERKCTLCFSPAFFPKAFSVRVVKTRDLLVTPG